MNIKSINIYYDTIYLFQLFDIKYDPLLCFKFYSSSFSKLLISSFN